MTGDRTPTGDLRERLAEALYRRLREQVGSDAGAQIRAEAKADDLVDAVLPVVEAAMLAVQVDATQRADELAARLQGAEAERDTARAGLDGALTGARFLREDLADLRAELTKAERERDEYRERFNNQMTAATELTDTLREAERQRDEALEAVAAERRGRLAAQAAVRRLRQLIESYPPGSRFARSGAQALFRRTLDTEPPRDEAIDLLRELTDAAPCTPHPGTGYCQTHGQRPPCPHAAAVKLLAALPEQAAGPPPARPARSRPLAQVKEETR